MINASGRQIVLDTETTGLSPKNGDRVIEIGAVELINLHPTGRHYQVYLDPERDIPEDSIRIHGITNEKVAGCPKFSEVVDQFLAFVADSPLVIHNAPFDMGFLNNELALCDRPPMSQKVVDTLVEAKRRHPRQRNSLDALCRRYNVDNSERTLHGALLDSEILTDVYVAMLGGHQTVLNGLSETWGGEVGARKVPVDTPKVCGLIPVGTTLPVGRRPILAKTLPEEVARHNSILERLGDGRIWRDAVEA